MTLRGGWSYLLGWWNPGFMTLRGPGPGAWARGRQRDIAEPLPPGLANCYFLPFLPFFLPFLLFLAIRLTRLLTRGRQRIVDQTSTYH